MRIGPFGPSEIGLLALGTLPWILGLALAVGGLALLNRLVRAGERIADALERERTGR